MANFVQVINLSQCAIGDQCTKCFKVYIYDNDSDLYNVCSECVSLNPNLPFVCHNCQKSEIFECSSCSDMFCKVHGQSERLLCNSCAEQSDESGDDSDDSEIEKVKDLTIDNPKKRKKLG